MLKFFAEKNVSSFCSAKATHIFSAKNIRILYIESAKMVNEMTLNELVKLTMLWTTGPCIFMSVQVGFMRSGRILAEDTPDNMMQRYQMQVTGILNHSLG